MGFQHQVVQKSISEKRRQAVACNDAASQPQDYRPFSGDNAYASNPAGSLLHTAPVKAQMKACQQEAPECTRQMSSDGQILSQAHRPKAQNIPGKHHAAEQRAQYREQKQAGKYALNSPVRGYPAFAEAFAPCPVPFMVEDSQCQHGNAQPFMSGFSYQGVAHQQEQHNSQCRICNPSLGHCFTTFLSAFSCARRIIVRTASP